LNYEPATDFADQGLTFLSLASGIPLAVGVVGVFMRIGPWHIASRHIASWHIRPRHSGSLIGAALAISFAATAQAAIVVNIDKSSQRMTVSVDGAARYTWPISTGRPGYDTPNGTFKANRMDADHLSQEWDNAPMPHTIFFDMHGHAIHGFFDVKHLGQPVSHGCVRLAPANAATLFALVQSQGMSQTTVVVSGQTPARGGEEMARRRAPVQQTAARGNDYQPAPPQPYDAQQAYGQQQYYRQGQQPAYAPPPQGYYRQVPAQGYYGQQQPYYAQQPQGYIPQQPPPVYVLRPPGLY
jgi:lipoprotein-anchoring transpeptidase ErfK/SrfK